MLVCINAAEDALFRFTATADRAALDVLRDGIEENADLQMHVRRSAHVDRSMLHSYVHDVLIPNNQLSRGVHGLSDAPALLLVDNSMTHLGDETMQLLLSNNVKIVTFPPHTSGIQGVKKVPSPLAVSRRTRFHAGFTFS
jgi:hypothetical protein